MDTQTVLTLPSREVCDEFIALTPSSKAVHVAAVICNVVR